MNDNTKSQVPEIPRSLEIEYQAAHQGFQGTNTQIWQSFSVISAMALAGMLFIGTLKTSGIGTTPRVTWPITMVVGISVIFILWAWLLLIIRWEIYAQVNLYRMRQIEEQFGMYVIRYGSWLRKRLSQSDISVFSNQERAQYKYLKGEFGRSLNYLPRQRIIIIAIVIILTCIWGFMIAFDYCGYLML